MTREGWDINRVAGLDFVELQTATSAVEHEASGRKREAEAPVLVQCAHCKWDCDRERKRETEA